MFLVKILGILLEVVLEAIHLILVLYVWLLVAAVIISWVNADPYNTIVRFIRNVTEPILAPIRRWLIKLAYKTGIDFSPLVAMLIVIFIDRLIMRIFMPIVLRMEQGG